MANIKNFGIVGVGSGVQFGKGGAQLIQTSGTFAAKNAAGNAFVRFQIADGASDGDAITFNQLTNAVTLIDANAAAIQSELNNTQVGAGLAADGSYTAPGGSNYLSNATSLADATELLDAALFAEATARADADAALANTVSNATANVGLIQSEIDQIESSVGLGTDGTLTLAAGNYLGNAISVVDAIETLDGVLGQTNSDLTNTNALVDGFAQDISDLNNAVASAESNVSSLSGRVDLVEANSVAQGGLIDGLRTDVDANSAILSNAVAELADHEDRIAALETNGDLANAVAELQQDITDEANARIAADSALSSDISNVAADVAAVEGDLTALSANAVLKDGSVMMTGALNMGGNVIANVATPNAASDAATKDYVDTKVATLGNAFNYIGALAGGADAANAYVLEDNIIPADRSAGDYYKVTTAGYFVMVNGDTANAAYFNVNDGLVFNTAGDFDKIDNTDSVVTGTVSEITVTGTVDTGFVVGIDGAYTTARQQEVSDEANARTLADEGLAQDISDETNARVAADAVLTSDLANTNANVALVAADVANNTANIASLNSRVTDLENADDLANAVADLEAEIANTNANVAVIAADLANTNANVATVIGDLNDEISRATQAESDLSNAVAAAEANTAAVASNLANTNANVAAVAGNVANAQSEIDAIETGAGLETDGSYLANASSHYLANATSLKSADEFLDTALFDLANTVATLSQDTIQTIDGLNKVHVSNDLITMSLNVGGNAVAVANVVAGANTNANLVMDFTTADEVRLAAMGSGADVDLRLVAQGQGHVIIGETGVGIIQADDGYDMTVAAGTGANLNLTGALVQVRDEANNLISQFAGVGGATAYSTLTNGNTSVSFGAAGAATDIDLVFAPKGAGTVDMSSARVVNVANATAGTDAVNKGQLDTAISTAAVGVVKTVVATLPATSGAVTLGTVTGTVLRVRVLINNAYDSGSTITVGTSGTPNDLAADTDIDESAPGVYVVETAKDYSAQSITATVTNATGTNGAAKVVVEYLAA